MQEPKKHPIYAVKINWYTSEDRLPTVDEKRFYNFAKAKKWAVELDAIGSPIYKTEVVQL